MISIGSDISNFFHKHFLLNNEIYIKIVKEKRFLLNLFICSNHWSGSKNISLEGNQTFLSDIDCIYHGARDPEATAKCDGDYNYIINIMNKEIRRGKIETSKNPVLD